MRLAPDPAVSSEDKKRAQRFLVLDSAAANLAGSLYGGVILVGFALALGARPATIGALSAIPLFVQLVQLPTIALVERMRQRRKIVVLAVTTARIIIVSLALLPFLPDDGRRLPLLLAAQVCITMLGSIAGCALNSWLHGLLPKESLGAFFADRLFWSTVAGAVGAATAGFLIDHWHFGEPLTAYSATFAAAGVAGFVSSWALTRVPEPVMDRTGPPLPVFSMIGAPFREPNFRRVIVFMASWNVASNIAAPFIAVYVLQQLRYPLSTVTTLWIASQVASALTLYLWGRLTDRLSNKSILAVALPIYFTCLLGLLFVAMPAKHFLTLPLLYAIHIMMGSAAGGIGLATASLGLKLAPPAQATSYLAGVSLTGSLAGGTASMFGGVLADVFSSRQMSLIFQWVSPAHTQNVTVMQVQHWEFLFAISFVLGFYVLHALSRISEGHTTSERAVIQQFVLEAFRSLDQLSSIEGLRTSALFPLGRLLERRRQARKASSGASEPP